MRCMMWFREDLRVFDNTALYRASKVSSSGLLAIYIISTEDWRKHDIAGCRVEFILNNLRDLSAQLQRLGIPLLLLKTDQAQAIPALLLNTMQHYKVDALYFNEQYELDEARRDMAVERLLGARGHQVFSYCDQVIMPPDEISTKAGGRYTKFTPYKNSWLQIMQSRPVHLSPEPSQQRRLDVQPNAIPLQVEGWRSTLTLEEWPAGAAHAQSRLKNFVTQRIGQYAQARNFPAITGSSKLSPYLAAGVLSSRQCLKAARDANAGKLEDGNAGISSWINELIWCEFYKYILHHFPRVSMGRAFKIATEDLQWSQNQAHFAAWCAGNTGFPIVDAAMRQLNKTGWMHNRLRLVTSMFLVKDLQINWRWGERYFMQHLLDGDLAANNGGWQWAASTGTDSAPYFRIFNPSTQSRRFDPRGEFIRHYCPELSALNDKEIHEPHKFNSTATLNYPKPIVNHEVARQKTLQLFRALNGRKMDVLS